MFSESRFSNTREKWKEISRKKGSDEAVSLRQLISNNKVFLTSYDKHVQLSLLREYLIFVQIKYESY